MPETAADALETSLRAPKPLPTRKTKMRPKPSDFPTPHISKNPPGHKQSTSMCTCHLNNNVPIHCPVGLLKHLQGYLPGHCPSPMAYDEVLNTKKHPSPGDVPATPFAVYPTGKQKFPAKKTLPNLPYYPKGIDSASLSKNLSSLQNSPFQSAKPEPYKPFYPLHH